MGNGREGGEAHGVCVCEEALEGARESGRSAGRQRKGRAVLLVELRYRHAAAAQGGTGGVSGSGRCPSSRLVLIPDHSIKACPISTG